MEKKESSGGNDYSETFYARHAERYAEVAHNYLQSIYPESSNPHLKGDRDLLNRLKELVPGKRGLDAGCGAGARDVFEFCSEGYDMWGIDAVPENVAVAHAWHPEIRDRVIIHDLRKPLPFNNAFFDFVLCNAVIQHIEPDLVHNVVLPELMRVLRTNGVLQLMFKDGEGTATVFDKDFGTERCFQLYRHDIVLKTMAEDRMEVIGNGKNKLGGIMRFVDPKGSRHCVFYLRKTGNGSLAAYKNAPKLS